MLVPMGVFRLATCSLVTGLLLLGCGVASADTLVKLATDPALSPDGKRLLFAYAGDLWNVSSRGGIAQRISSHPAEESRPLVCPEGTRLAFISRRSGTPQVWIQSINAQGRVTGTPRQVTHHTSGYQLESWYPDGQHLLVSASRDAYWYPRENGRFFRVAVDQRRADEMLFDDYGTAPSLSPDGADLLFQREGVAWWRKGYRGTQAGQIWQYDGKRAVFTQRLHSPSGDRSPIWKPDGSGYYCVSQRGGTFNLWEQDLDSDDARQLTNFDDDSVVMPTLSADGSLIVFRHGFDFYRLSVGEAGAKPKRIEIRIAGDAVSDPILRRTLSSATDASFTADGLEITFAAGGDIWVMDTNLREPINLTRSAGQESEPLFVEDGRAILFLRDIDGAVNLWRAEPTVDDQFWWQQSDFQLTPLTSFPDTMTGIQVSPNGCEIGYVRKPGDLYVADLDGKNPRRIISGFNVPSYDFSPDGRWIAYAQNDNDFNSDIWIVPVDGSSEPVNISRHPKNDYSPKWSPDGRMLAFSGVRDSDETDLHYVYLTRKDSDATTRDRSLEKAIKKLTDARKQKGPAGGETQSSDDGESKDSTKGSSSDKDRKSSELPTVEIDFDEIHERVRRIKIAGASVSGLFWFGEGQKLAMRTTIDGREGTYFIEFPDMRTPKLLTTDRGSFATRLKNPKQVGWVNDGVPGTLATDGELTKYSFFAKQEMDQTQRFRAGFDVAWRLMRDQWYDDRLGNRNWDSIRRKYVDAAAASPDVGAFATVVQMMLGELNGSHLGFSPSGAASFSPPGWLPQTAHLGVRFDPTHLGPGLRIRDVLPGGPAERKTSRLEAGETILSIDGVAVDADYDLTQVLNGTLDRDLRLLVVAAPPALDGEPTDPVNGSDPDSKADAPSTPPSNERGVERTVHLRPISFSAAQSLLYPMWEEENRRKVDDLSEGKLGYLHIQGMNLSSLFEFERQLFNVGYGKDGLLIDVRGNGGGSTADRLLTALTQPRHAITVPRGGGPGYPQDRMVYATWSKPIVVLCNQNSFSNAEIFSHAIRVLGRGKLVGVQTAGGVISTGSASVLDLGTLRQPFRGWFSIETGEDMELNGAKPHVEVWPHPGEMATGTDRALNRAVRLLIRDVEQYRSRPQPKLTKATQRGSD